MKLFLRTLYDESTDRRIRKLGLIAIRTKQTDKLITKSCAMREYSLKRVKKSNKIGSNINRKKVYNST